MRPHLVDQLRHRLRRIRATPDLDDFRRALELMSQRLDFAREGRREHQRLPFLGQRPNDLPDRREKAHVEHPIGFIEHEKFDPGKIRLSLFHQIDQPSRRCDHQLHPRSQRLDLRPFAHPAKHRRHAQRQMPRIRAHVFLDLHDQLARRRHDQRLHPAPLTIRAGRGKFRQDRQDERRCLPRAGLRDADDVATGQDFRDGSELDRSRFGITGVLDGLENGKRKLERAKRHETGTIARK